MICISKREAIFFRFERPTKLGTDCLVGYHYYLFTSQHYYARPHCLKNALMPVEAVRQQFASV